MKPVSIHSYREPSTSIGGGIDCYVFIEPPTNPEFERRLLMELLAIARPVGLGAIEAMGRRLEEIDDTLREGLIKSRRRDGCFNFDYVNGYRIKVRYYPTGLSVWPDTDLTDPGYRHPGWPLLASTEFEEMYGEGSLAQVAALALGGTGGGPIPIEPREG